LYNGLPNALNVGDVLENDVGWKMIIPSSFQGDQHIMGLLYEDAMVRVSKFGKPEFFVTFIFNPKWKEITDALLPEQIP
jgi:hypothetical protein